ncbi:MAG: aminotransferase class V-fold PLP-dependent enzyme [Helicobacter sp.]|nr:aminotransferase class V-fold PLP-dependent enzyme [Helicobacter sp.]
MGNELLVDFFAPLLESCTKSQKVSILKNSILFPKDKLYCDWTASALAYLPIEKRILDFLPFYANTHSESSQHSEFTSALYAKTRENLKKILGLDSSFALISCGFGSSAAMKKFQELLGIYIPPKTREILKVDKNNPKLKSSLPLVIIGPYEHHSNELSLREGLCEVVRIPLNCEGLFCMESLKTLLAQSKGRKIIASMALASNVSGIVVPYDEISYRIREQGGIVCFDMSSSSPYFDIPSQYYDVAFLSPHKLLGGIGSSGILVIKKALIDKSLPPTFSGGGVVGYVSRSSQQYFSDEESREEAGTPGILEFLKAGLAYSLRNELGCEWIMQQKAQHNQVLLEFFLNEPEIVLYGNPKANALGIFSFNLKGHNPFKLAQNLSQDFGIMLRAGCACAGPYGHDLLGLPDSPPKEKPGFIRMNSHYSHTNADIDYFCQCLKKFIKS